MSKKMQRVLYGMVMFTLVCVLVAVVWAGKSRSVKTGQGILNRYPADSQAGNVETTKKAAGAAGGIYVAGNPDLYPVEYYNRETKQYEGILPELLAQISAETGIDFVYVHAGTDDERRQLAKNRQVEIVSGCLKHEGMESEYGTLGDTLFTIEIGGKTYEVAFAYTAIASESLKNQMETYLAGISSSELTRLAVSYSHASGRRNRPLWLSVLAAAGIVTVLAVVGFLVQKTKRLRRQVTREQWTRQMLESINDYQADARKGTGAAAFCAGICKLEKSDAACEHVLQLARQGYHDAAAHQKMFCFSDDKMLREAKGAEELKHQMAGALERHEFLCYIQFIKDSRTEQIYGAEVLTRWQHPDKGLLMPGKYIGDMEENEMIVDLDYYVFEEACRLLTQFGAGKFAFLYLFCNFSGRTVARPDFVERLKLIAQSYEFDRRKMCLEIAEGSLLEQREVVLDNLKKCRKYGFMTAMDDVGNGHSSFSDLRDYPIDIIKLDRDILLSTAKQKGRQLMEGMNDLFHRLGRSTLCEGIETETQYRMVQKMGIDFMQGFYIQRALPVNEGIRWLRENMQLEKED